MRATWKEAYVRSLLPMCSTTTPAFNPFRSSPFCSRHIRLAVASPAAVYLPQSHSMHNILLTNPFWMSPFCSRHIYIGGCIPCGTHTSFQATASLCSASEVRTEGQVRGDTQPSGILLQEDKLECFFTMSHAVNPLQSVFWSKYAVPWCWLTSYPVDRCAVLVPEVAVEDLGAALHAQAGLPQDGPSPGLYQGVPVHHHVIVLHSAELVADGAFSSPRYSQQSRTLSLQLHQMPYHRKHSADASCVFQC